VVVEDQPTADELRQVGLDPESETLFGLYQGVPWGERGWDYGGQLPDRIVIYRRPLLEECTTHEELLEEIRLTVIHEVGHYFGLDEDQLP
jgi:predicted Zn-dependent protease with MMP-like domain